MRGLLFSFVLLLVSGVASANVDVSRRLRFPAIDGLRVSTELPTEINRHVEQLSFTLSLGNAAVDAVLAGAGLPPREVTSVERIETPQCKVAQLRRGLDARVLVDDQAWLKQKSWWCRFTRSLFGACKPKSFDDVVAVARVAPNGSERDELVQEHVEPIALPACVSDAETDGDRAINALRDCLAAGGAVSGAQCATVARASWTKLERSADGRQWSLPLTTASARAVRQGLAPLVAIKNHKTELVSLRLAGAQLDPLSDRSAFATTLDFSGYLAFGSSAPGADKLELAARYQASVDGLPQGRADEKTASLPATFRELTLRNFPSAVGIARGEIHVLESFAAADEAQKSKAAQMYGWCAEHTTNRSEFGQFVCSLGYEMLNVLSRRVQVRLSFTDQDGVDRLVTWERRAPNEACWLSGATGYTCRVGRSESEWNTWINGNGEEQLLQQVFHDPSYGPETLVVLDGIASFLPKAIGAEPLRSFVTAQSLSLRVDTSRERRDAPKPSAVLNALSAAP